MAQIEKRAYAEMFGPTVGDRLRLADTDLIVEVEQDYTLRAGSYGEEVKNLSAVRTAIVDPGRTRTQMRAKAYPGEDPATVKEPSVVADAIVALLTTEFDTGHRLVVEG